MTFCFELNRNEIHPKVSWGKFWMAAGMNNAECSWVGPHLVTKTIVFPRLVSSVEKGRTTKQERSHLKGKSQLKTLKQNKKTMSPTSEINENRPPNMQTTGITQQNPQQNKCPLGKGRAVPSLGKFVYSCGF